LMAVYLGGGKTGTRPGAGRWFVSPFDGPFDR
jgi:hypothetical protein